MEISLDVDGPIDFNPLPASIFIISMNSCRVMKELDETFGAYLYLDMLTYTLNLLSAFSPVPSVCRSLTSAYKCTYFYDFVPDVRDAYIRVTELFTLLGIMWSVDVVHPQ